jgi:hypothetical protein
VKRLCKEFGFTARILEGSLAEGRKKEEMKEVILHIGMHKTGTSSIQNSMKGVGGDGIRVARFTEVNHSIPMYTMFSENRYNYHVWKNRGFTVNEIDRKKDEFFKILEEEIANSTISKLVISGEDISLLSVLDQELLCNSFQSKGIVVKVIYIVREPMAWAVSAHQQRACGGEKKLFKINPEYKKRLQGFFNRCGAENISVYKYEHLIEKGLIKSFSEIIGIKLEKDSRRNESITLEALAVLYVFNNIEVPTLGTDIRFQARQLVLRAIFDFFSKGNNYTKLNLKGFDIVDADIEGDLA